MFKSDVKPKQTNKLLWNTMLQFLDMSVMKSNPVMQTRADRVMLKAKAGCHNFQYLSCWPQFLETS